MIIFVDNSVFTHNTSSIKNTKAEKKFSDDNYSYVSIECETLKDRMTDTISIL